MPNPQPRPPQLPDRLGLPLALVALAVLLAVVGGVRLLDDEPRSQGVVLAPVIGPPFEEPLQQPLHQPTAPPDPVVPVEPLEPTPQARPQSPAPRIFDDRRFLVAYYGTAGTGALGVLGETTPDQMQRRLMRAAGDFRRPNQPIQPVYEVIVTIADPRPGPGGDYSHDIARADVQRYIDAAHRHGALVLLDLQPGRSHFLDVAKRWAWALRDPYVGLALDPEWRMSRTQVPGQSIGSVDATEINQVSRWLVQLQATHDLPQKLFVLHQFRSDMVRRSGSVQPRPSLAMVQHVDGFGTPSQKRATFDAVAQPQKFRLGFKLFYDEDVDRMGSTEVHRLRPKVRFVSFQ